MFKWVISKLPWNRPIPDKEVRIRAKAMMLGAGSGLAVGKEDEDSKVRIEVERTGKDDRSDSVVQSVSDS